MVVLIFMNHHIQAFTIRPYNVGYCLTHHKRVVLHQMIMKVIHVSSQEAMDKDTQDRSSGSDTNLKSYLSDAYLHPIFNSFEEAELVEVRVDKNQTRIPSRPTSGHTSPSPPHHIHHHQDETSHNVQHYEVGPPGNYSHYEYQQHDNMYRYDTESPQHIYQY